MAREVGKRQGAERRYSDGLRQQAVAYWRAREVAGDGVRAVATVLGVAPVSLRRWAEDPRFRPVHVVADEALTPTRLVVVVDRTSIRVGGRRRRDGGAARRPPAMRWAGHRVTVYAHSAPTDMRKGFDSLCGLVTEQVGRNPTQLKISQESRREIRRTIDR